MANNAEAQTAVADAPPKGSKAREDKDKENKEKAEALTDLPKGIVKRLLKAKLSAINKNDSSRDVTIHKDALLACSESAKVFISFVTAAAFDICQEKKRQTISAEDVLAALEELEFGEWVPQLRETLQGGWMWDKRNSGGDGIAL